MGSLSKPWLKAAILGFSLGFAPATAAWADDVTEQLNEAMKAYNDKDLPAAATALDLAATLIRQMSAEIWKTVLPAPLPGWDAEEAETTTAGPAMLGGGTSISRKYNKKNDNIEISLITGSPILQQMGALLGVGLMTSSDMKLSIIDGRKMTYTKSENSYQTMVANKVLVKVEGSKGVEDAPLRAYVAAIDFQKIEKQAR